MTTTYSVINPFNQELIAEFPFMTWDNVNEQLALLRSGLAIQRQTTPDQRARILRRLASLLEEESEKLAQMITLETGKTITDARVELARAVNAAVSASEEARQITGEVLDSDCFPSARGKLSVVVWRPLGVILCIADVQAAVAATIN